MNQPTLILEKTLPLQGVVAGSNKLAKPKQVEMTASYFGVYLNNERVGEVKIIKEIDAR